MSDIVVSIQNANIYQGDSLVLQNVNFNINRGEFVYLVGKTEKLFGQGGPAGEKQTGPWLRPGLVFKVRSSDGGPDLGTLTVAARQDCPKQ